MLDFTANEVAIAIEDTVANVARAAALKIFGKRELQLGKPTVVFYTRSETEILIKETLHLELQKLGLMK